MAPTPLKARGSFLVEAAKQYPHDSAILSAYAYREFERHQVQQAKELYETALPSDPLRCRRRREPWRDRGGERQVRESTGSLAGCIRARALAKLGGDESGSLSCNLGKPKDAETYLRRVPEFNPDLPDARAMLGRLDGQPGACGSSR
jgi:tetratricopeptide (TPR) repeat protein